MMSELKIQGVGNTKISPLELGGENVGWFLEPEGGFLVNPTETRYIQGEHDYRNCKESQELLEGLTIQLTEIFNGNVEKGAKPFPFCCGTHSNLTKVKEFSRVDFVGVPEMVAKKIVYTDRHIKNHHYRETYYKEITDYIDYTVHSFGQMPSDCGEPLYLRNYYRMLIHLLNQNVEINSERKSIILKYLEELQSPNTESNNFNLPALLTTYQKWLKEFPFDLKSYFGDLKQYFERWLPILNGKPEKNIYSGIVKAKRHTESSFIETLTDLTRELLSGINAKEMVEKGLVKDLNKHRFELESERLRIATRQITEKFSKGELKYIKVLKSWLNLHKEYFKEISPLLSANPPGLLESKNDKLKNALSSYGFYELYQVRQLSETNKHLLTELISSKGLPYSIAMFHFLGFLVHLEKQHFQTKYKLNKEVSKWLGSDKDGRNVKGNISTLSDYTKEDKKKFTAHLHKEQVEKDYQNLK